jgi:ribosomal protein S18 acetylase RimI-like enzyme
MQVKYCEHLPPEFKLPAVRLYLSALEEKLMPILGGFERAVQVLNQNIDLDHCLAALCNDRLVGILGMQTREGSFWNPTLKSFITEYGLVGGLTKYGGLSLLHHETDSDEWYIDGIAVEAEMRGQGVGTKLLGQLEHRARTNGIYKITLEVINTNHRAEALYRRLGYCEINRANLWPFNRIYGFPFESAVQMAKLIRN